MKKIKKYLIAGLVTVVPVFVTVYALVVSFRFIDGILGRFLNAFLKETLGFYIPGLGFVLFSLLLICAGFIATWLLGRRLFRGIEKWFAGLPLVNKIYPTVKQIVTFILAQKEFGFRKVALIEYPSKGIWSLGFLTNEEFSKMGIISERDMVTVFVPTTPSPLSGFVVFVPRQDVTFLDIPVSDALKILISGGVVKP